MFANGQLNSEMVHPFAAAELLRRMGNGDQSSTTDLRPSDLQTF
jgi:hypothetical protein